MFSLILHSNWRRQRINKLTAGNMMGHAVKWAKKENKAGQRDRVT